MTRTHKWSLGPGIELWAGDRGELVVAARGAIVVELARSIDAQRAVVTVLANELRNMAGLPELAEKRWRPTAWAMARTARITDRIWLLQSLEQLCLFDQLPGAGVARCVGLAPEAARKFIDVIFVLEATSGTGGG